MSELNIKQKILLIIIIIIIAIIICYYAYTKEKGGKVETKIIETKVKEDSKDEQLRSRRNFRTVR